MRPRETRWSSRKLRALPATLNGRLSRNSSELDSPDSSEFPLRQHANEEYELKSQKGKFGAKVADGAYKTKSERLVASNNPNLLLMNYDLKSLAVVNLFIVPKHFFVRDIIERRKPLAATARRAGWIGSNILLGKVP